MAARCAGYLVDVAAPHVRRRPARVLGVDGDAGVGVVAVVSSGIGMLLVRICTDRGVSAIPHVHAARLISVVPGDIDVEIGWQGVPPRIGFIEHDQQSTHLAVIQVVCSQILTFPGKK